jgi:hypothetical protein
MAELLVVGGLAFWIAMLVWFVILWALVEHDYGFLGLVSIVVYGCLLQFGFKADVLGWMTSHWIMLAIFGGLYFFIGGGWAFWRWFLFAKDQLEPYTQMKTEWLVSKGESQFTQIPAHLKEEWVKYIENDWRRKEMCQTPLVRDHKSKIFRWIGYWPISAISWALNDMVRRFVKMVYNYIHDWLQSVANRVFATVKNDLPPDFKYNR